MSATQSWAELPDFIKRQAAPGLLAGGGWYHCGKLVDSPGAVELRRWVGTAPESPQAGTEVDGSIRAAVPNISQRMTHKRKARTRRQKRDAVDQEFTDFPGLSDRELARRLGVSHTFIAMRRRKAGNVAGADDGK